MADSADFRGALGDGGADCDDFVSVALREFGDVPGVQHFCGYGNATGVPRVFPRVCCGSPRATGAGGLARLGNPHDLRGFERRYDRHAGRIHRARLASRRPFRHGSGLIVLTNPHLFDSHSYLFALEQNKLLESTSWHIQATVGAAHPKTNSWTK